MFDNFDNEMDEYNRNYENKMKQLENERLSREEKKVNKVLNIAKIAAVVLFVVFAICDSVYSISETEKAVVTTFGKAEEIEGKGLKFKIPFIQNVDKINTTVQGFPIGYGVNDDGSTYDVDEESIMITSDYNFIDVDYYVSYEIKDPIKYLYAAEAPEIMLKNIAISSIRSTLSAYTVDSALTTGKTEIQYNVKQMIMEELEKQDIGIVLVDATLQDVEPPNEDVNNAFKAVETAKQDKESEINKANQYRNEQIPAAEAKADKIKQDAEATKTARINEAEGQVSRFEKEYEEFKKYPLITKQRMFFEAMADILPELKVIIDDGSGNIEKYYPIESFVNIEESKSKE